MRKAIIPGLVLVAGIAVLVMFGCKIEPKNPVEIGNEWPRIYLVNVPPDSSQLPHAPIIYWYGADPDGYIVGYHWAIDDTSTWEILDVDSVLGTEDTIAFAAPLPDTEFTHIFYVRAVDNEGAVTISDSIARRVFRVTNIPPVNTAFEEAPDSAATVFVRTDTLTTWEGVYFEWSTEDSDQVFAPQFSWRWDSGAWSAWDEATEKYFTGADDPALGTNGQHWLYLRARDDAMAIDSSAAPRLIEVCVPTFQYDLLVIDQTRNMGGGPVTPNDQEVDDFYKLILDNAGWSGFDTLENSGDGPIDHFDIGDHRILLLHSDDVGAASIPGQSVLSEYLDVGGRLFVTGYQAVEALDAAFHRTYLGADSGKVNDVNTPGDFIGAFPLDTSAFSYFEVDTTKLLGAWGGGIPNVGFYYLQNIFNGLYSFDSRSDSIDFEGRAAVLFQYDYEEDDTNTYRTAASSFPLYRIKTDASGEPLVTTVRAVLDSLDR
jgi:hypothetical protein